MLAFLPFYSPKYAYCFTDGALAASMENIMYQPQFLKRLEKAGKDNTSELESHNSVVNRFATKQIGFNHDGLTAR